MEKLPNGDVAFKIQYKIINYEIICKSSIMLKNFFNNFQFKATYVDFVFLLVNNFKIHLYSFLIIKLILLNYLKNKIGI